MIVPQVGLQGMHCAAPPRLSTPAW
jgi:hypothetical protein